MKPDIQKRKKRYQALVCGAAICTAVSAAFALGPGFFLGDSDQRGPETMALGAAVGWGIGFAALPWFAPDLFKPRPGICALIGAVIGASAALYLRLPVVTLCVTTLATGVIGYAAPLWVRRM